MNTTVICFIVGLGLILAGYIQGILAMWLVAVPFFIVVLVKSIKQTKDKKSSNAQIGLNIALILISLFFICIGYFLLGLLSWGA